MTTPDPPRDAGSAVIEFVVLAVAVLVPMVYVVQCLHVTYSAVLASSQAVREAARVFSTSATTAQGLQRAEAAARLAFSDHGFDLPDGALLLRCADGPCLAPGSAVVADVEWRVRLPWLPDTWSVDASIPVSGSQRVPIDDFRGDPG